MVSSHVHWVVEFLDELKGTKKCIKELIAKSLEASMNQTQWLEEDLNETFMTVNQTVAGRTGFLRGFQKCFA